MGYPLISLTQVMGVHVVSSNYLPNSTTPTPKFVRQICGDGVNRRLHWRQLSEPAKSSPLDYVKTWETMDHGQFYYNHDEYGPSGQHLFDYEFGPIGSMSGELEFDLSVETDADYKAKVKLFDQMKGEGANLANMLGERHQVVHSVVNVLNTIGGAARDLRRGNIVSAIRRFGGDPKTARQLRGKDIADMWLSLQYGWKPLLSDIYDLVNNAHKREAKPRVFRASAKQTITGTSITTQYKQAGGWSPNVSYSIRQNTAIVKYMIRAMPNMSIAEPAALGFTNPLEVLWEVTPWSFVVDWFLPIGNYLDQLTADHGWYFYDGCKSTLDKASTSGGVNYQDHHTGSGWTYSTYGGWHGSTDWAKMLRQTLTGFPTPSLPQFKNPFSLGHLENAFALAYQAFGRSDTPRFPQGNHGRGGR